ncbi:MAG: site-specific integrase [Thermodesulfobacteriota bacterium]|jgi:integrase
MGGDCKVRLINSDLVFPTSHGTPIRDNNIERAFRLALKEAAVMDFRFHDLRHTAATRMVQNGVDLYKVQLILGHKGPQMTQRYAHHYPESLRSAVDTLEKVSQICHNRADQQNNQSYNKLKSQHAGQ